MDDLFICGCLPWMKSTNKDKGWRTWTQPMFLTFDPHPIRAMIVLRQIFYSFTTNHQLTEIVMFLLTRVDPSINIVGTYFMPNHCNLDWFLFHWFKCSFFFFETKFDHIKSRHILFAKNIMMCKIEGCTPDKANE